MTQSTLTGDEPPSDDTNDRQETTRNSQSPNSETDNIVQINSSDAIATWKNSLEEDDQFAYGTITARVIRTLEAEKYAMDQQYESRTEAMTPLTKFASGGSTPFIDCLEWALNTLATPYIEPQNGMKAFGRDIPKDNIKIFVPDRVYKYLAVDTDEVQTLIERFDKLPEVTATEAEHRLYKKQMQQHQLRAPDGLLENYRRAIEHTIRHKLEFTSKYGHEVPDPDKRLADWNLIVLRTELDAVREHLDMCEEYEAELNAEIDALESDRYTQLVTEHFPNYTDDLLED